MWKRFLIQFRKKLQVYYAYDNDRKTSAYLNLFIEFIYTLICL